MISSTIIFIRNKQYCQVFYAWPSASVLCSISFRNALVTPLLSCNFTLLLPKAHLKYHMSSSSQILSILYLPCLVTLTCLLLVKKLIMFQIWSIWLKGSHIIRIIYSWWPIFGDSGTVRGGWVEKLGHSGVFLALCLILRVFLSPSAMRWTSSWAASSCQHDAPRFHQVSLCLSAFSSRRWPFPVSDDPNRQPRIKFFILYTAYGRYFA